MKAPLVFDRAPKPENGEALGPAFENATAHGARTKLAADVKSALGDQAAGRMLAFAAEVDDPAWDATYAQLDEKGKELLKSILSSALVVGHAAYGLRRAVVLTPLGDAARVGPLEKRISELLDGDADPAAVGVMIRALAVSTKSRAAAVGCKALKKLKMDDGRVGTEILAEASALAIANDVLGGAALACKDDVARALTDACVPQVRCAKGAPLTGHETSDQDEPLCTKEELAPVVGQELARTPADALAAKTGTRKELFAYAALVAAKSLPDSFVQAHERRRYAIAQPDKPACDSGLPLGTPCHCSEADLRDHACRGSSVHPGICKSEVDDKAKKIGNVVTAIGP
ncbi:MAG TPA: hypothetical protein VIF62_31140, partial [Labilithrix sp.]|jgi:hypothetical protein